MKVFYLALTALTLVAGLGSVVSAAIDCATDFPLEEDCNSAAALTNGCFFDYDLGQCTSMTCTHQPDEFSCASLNASCTWNPDAVRCLEPGETVQCEWVFDITGENCLKYAGCGFVGETPTQPPFCYSTNNPESYCPQILDDKVCLENVTDCEWVASGSSGLGACIVFGGTPPCYIYGSDSECTANAPLCHWSTISSGCFDGPPTTTTTFPPNPTTTKPLTTPFPASITLTNTNPPTNPPTTPFPASITLTDTATDYPTFPPSIGLTSTGTDYPTFATFTWTTTTYSPSASGGPLGISVTAVAVIAVCAVLLAGFLVALVVKYKNHSSVRVGVVHPLADDATNEPLPRYAPKNHWATHRLDVEQIV